MTMLSLAAPFAPGVAVQMRLSAALVLSALLHAAVLYDVYGAGRSGAPSADRYDVALSARLLPAEPAPAPAAALGAAAPEPTLESPAPAPRPAVTPQPAGAIAPATPGPSGPGQISGLRYYLGTELDRRATPLQAIEPEYPDDPGDRERNVVLRVFINERGTVDNVVVQAAGQAESFENSARTAFARARFSPGILRGAPVKSQLLVEVKFDPGASSARRGDAAATVTERAD